MHISDESLKPCSPGAGVLLEINRFSQPFQEIKS
uniref:Photosystem I reaction centre subunit IX / PsaJ n=1 Tax=Siphoviridae sp. ctBLh2 TaxID=2827803 RepID=A0A8S5S423_9CAUD|nr:MAG TPA: Photosystem I reaction centre subunit IX / PsaJ [Siphoviridae sp. ctBLh2]